MTGSPHPPPPPPARRGARAPGGRGALEADAWWTPLDLVVLACVTALAAALRLWRLGDPPSIVFDETYYARDACLYARLPHQVCGISVEQTQVHPPLGKWLIATGIRVFGYDAVGWRIAAALAGALTVALLYVLARKLLRSTWGAALASGLLAFDFLHFVQSRIAMLDVFVALFAVAAVLFLALDRDAPTRAGAPLRPWRLAAGAAAGAAAASKWSGMFVIVTVLVVTLATDVAKRRARGWPRALAGALREEGLATLIACVAAPIAVYVASYVGRLDGVVLSWPWSPGSWARSLWDRQLYMLDFHTGLRATHPYASPPWSWPLLKRPVSYFFETAPNGDYMEIVALGNPLVWWTSLPALAFVAYTWATRRGAPGLEGLIVAAFALNYLPWLLLAGDRSAVFLFYLLPAVPFMCLALAYVPVRLGWVRSALPAVIVGAAVVVASFAFYFPLLADLPITRDEWLSRIWIFDECERPSPQILSSGSGSATSGSATGVEAADVEPKGWCWI